MPDLDLAGIAVEGAVDRFCGRPRDENPYSYTHARACFEAWLFGWDDASWLLEMRGRDEARRWLKERA